MPASIRMSNAMITPSVRRAFSAVGSRNAFPAVAARLHAGHGGTAAGERLEQHPPTHGRHGRRSGWQPHHGSRMAAAPERLEQTNGDRDQQSSDEEVRRN